MLYPAELRAQVVHVNSKILRVTAPVGADVKSPRQAGRLIETRWAKARRHADCPLPVQPALKRLHEVRVRTMLVTGDVEAKEQTASEGRTLQKCTSGVEPRGKQTCGGRGEERALEFLGRIAARLGAA